METKNILPEGYIFQENSPLFPSRLPTHTPLPVIPYKNLCSSASSFNKLTSDKLK